MLKLDCEQLHLLHHRAVLELQQQEAATRIQNQFRRYKAKKAFDSVIEKIVKIQRWMRNRVANALHRVLERQRSI